MTLSYSDTGAMRTIEYAQMLLRTLSGALRLALWSLLLCLASMNVLAQHITHSILYNSVTNLHAEGEALWVGPFLNVTRDGGATWQVADADSLAGLVNRAYSIDVDGEVIWAGLGATRSLESSGVQQSVDLARGFVFSTDGGATWTYRSPKAPTDGDPLTTGILDLPDDTVTVYGGVGLPTLAITVPEQSPPWDIDYDPLTGHVWTANQLAGLRRSMDGGLTWQRIVLPPDTTDYLAPHLGYRFPFFVQPTRVPVDQFFGLNFQVFSVLVDAIGTVWAGAAGGLNKSLDSGESWYHYTTADGLTGNWILSIEEQVRPSGAPVIWVATGPGRGEGEAYGAVVSRDGGETFEQVLINETVYDFAFDGSQVYIAGLSGLFISADDGRTFRTEREFYDPTQPERTILPGTAAYAVATTPTGLWVGTEDGLFNSKDGGDTWRIYRADVPLTPEGLPPVVPASRVPKVEAYAYPNPFSPSSDRLVRLRYRLESEGQVTIRIFDFGMNLVRRLTDSGSGRGEREVSWDGTSDSGTRVANGAYFYAIQTGGDTFWGKFLVLE